MEKYYTKTFWEGKKEKEKKRKKKQSWALTTPWAAKPQPSNKRGQARGALLRRVCTHPHARPRIFLTKCTDSCVYRGVSV